MIRELICYRCTCIKCGHSWTTKTHDVPPTCAGVKCRSRKWNDDRTEVPASQLEPLHGLAKPEFAPAVTAVLPDLPSFLLSQAEPPTVEPDEWAGWSEERSTVDTQAGETVYYREHLKTRKRIELRRETYFD